MLRPLQPIFWPSPPTTFDPDCCPPFPSDPSPCSSSLISDVTIELAAAVSTTTPSKSRLAKSTVSRSLPSPPSGPSPQPSDSRTRVRLAGGSNPSAIISVLFPGLPRSSASPDASARLHHYQNLHLCRLRQGYPLVRKHQQRHRRHHIPRHVPSTDRPRCRRDHLR